VGPVILGSCSRLWGTPTKVCCKKVRDGMLSKRWRGSLMRFLSFERPSMILSRENG
jgi:hypothetical protein